MSRSVNITYRDAREMAESIVGEFGSGYTIGPGGCFYAARTNVQYDEWGSAESFDVKPVCLVGQIMARLGMPAKDMLSIGVLATSRHEFEEFGYTFTDRAFFFLDALQSIQDSGYIWGDALQIASKLTTRHAWGTEEQFEALGK